LNGLRVFEIQQVGARIVAIRPALVALAFGDLVQQMPGFAGDDITFAVGTAVAMNDFKASVTIKQGLIEAFLDLMPRLFPGLAVMGDINFIIQLAERLMQRGIALGAIQYHWIDRNTAVWVCAVDQLGWSGHVFGCIETNRTQWSMLHAEVVSG